VPSIQARHLVCALNQDFHRSTIDASHSLPAYLPPSHDSLSPQFTNIFFQKHALNPSLTQPTPTCGTFSITHSLTSSNSTALHPSTQVYLLGHSPPPYIILDLLNFPKNCTNNSIILTHFHKILNSIPESLLCYTDGSRIHNHVGIAHSVDSTIYSFRLRNSSSIFTAELLAIFHCLETILSGPLPQSPSIVIITDSLSSVHATADPYSTHPVATHIYTLLSTFQAISCEVTLL